LTDLLVWIERVAAFTPDKAAIRFEGETITFAAFAGRCRAVLDALTHRLGLAPGDRVALLADNHPDTLALLFACSRCGVALVPLNWRLADDELAFMLRDAGPLALLAGPVHEARAERLAAGMEAAAAAGGGRRAPTVVRLGPDLTDAADGATGVREGEGGDLLVIYTSGTTGRPKGACLGDGAITGNAIQSVHMHQMTAADHVLTVLPMFHVGGLNIQTTPALLAGATVTMHARFDAEGTLSAIERERPTLVVLVPTMMQAIMALPRFGEADLSSLRAVTTGSTIVPEPLIAAWEARGVEVLCVYGCTETCPIAAYDVAGVPRVRGGTGRTGILTEIAILDEAGDVVGTGTHGEIAVRGNTFRGYLGDPSAGWDRRGRGYFLTGDMGSLAEDGTLTVHGRRNNMIVSGGENVYPAEVERVLSDHPAVGECAVVGRADSRWQEVPVAFVRLSSPVTEDALKAHVRARLAGYKVPREVRFVEALPRTALGKVRYDTLRAMAGGEGPRDLA